MIKKLTKLFMVIALIAISVLVPSKINAAAGEYVDDQYGVMTAEEVTKLDETLKKVSLDNNINIVIAIVNSTNGQDIDDFSLAYFKEKYGESNGILMLLDMEQLTFLSSTFGQTGDIVSTDTLDRCNDIAITYFNDGQFYQGFDAWVGSVDSSLKGELLPSSNQSGTTDPSDGSYVINPDGYLSADEEQDLENMIADIRSKYSFDVVIVINASTNGKSAMAYADDFFDYNGYGFGSSKDGLLFLVTMNDDEGDRTYWTSTSGYGITAFTDYGIDQIGSDVQSYLTSGDYYKAFKKYLDEVPMYLDAAKSGKPIDVDNHLYTRKDAMIWLAIGGGIGAIIATIVVLILHGQLKNKKKAVQANQYIVPGSFQVTSRADIFMYRRTTSRVHPKNTNSGGGGGSSVHFSSSGGSHGGGGGHF